VVRPRVALLQLLRVQSPRLRREAQRRLGGSDDRSTARRVQLAEPLVLGDGLSPPLIPTRPARDAQPPALRSLPRRVDLQQPIEVVAAVRAEP